MNMDRVLYVSVFIAQIITLWSTFLLSNILLLGVTGRIRLIIGNPFCVSLFRDKILKNPPY